MFFKVFMAFAIDQILVCSMHGSKTRGVKTRNTYRAEAGGLMAFMDFMVAMCGYAKPSSVISEASQKQNLCDGRGDDFLRRWMHGNLTSASTLVASRI